MNNRCFFSVLKHIEENFNVEKVILDTSQAGAMRAYEKLGFYHEKNIPFENMSNWLNLTNFLHGLELRKYSLYLQK